MPFTEEYKKLLLIGRGSFAAVYKVKHRTLGYIRAIKISNEMVDDEKDKAYQSFLNECKLLLKIGNGCHPNIVHIYQPRLINNHAIVEMDYVDGVTLTEYVREHKFVPMHEFWNFAEGILSAVGYCHADLYKFLMDPDEDNLETAPDDGDKYLITPEKEAELRQKYCVNHNDLHSNNIMRRNYDGSYILLDFGLAIQEKHCVKSSSRGDGAYEYSSPEKLDGKEITSASDVYSLGILMYEMLSGQVPFVMGTSGSMSDINRIYNRQLHETPAPIESLRKAAFEAANPGKTYVKDYPDELEQVIMRCLEKRPEDRFADAKEALEALQASKAMISDTSGDAEAVIAALKADIKRLENENRELRLNLESGRSPISNGQQTALYTIGQVTDDGQVCTIDSTGAHGLLLVKTSSTPLRSLRMVEEEVYENFTYHSKMWYKENAFILPRGTHLPTKTELEGIMTNAKNLGLDFAVWMAKDESGQAHAFDLRTGRILDDASNSYTFMALKAF